jgi:hypothetical protein
LFGRLPLSSQKAPQQVEDSPPLVIFRQSHGNLPYCFWAIALYTLYNGKSAIWIRPAEAIFRLERKFFLLARVSTALFTLYNGKSAIWIRPAEAIFRLQAKNSTWFVEQVANLLLMATGWQPVLPRTRVSTALYTLYNGKSAIWIRPAEAIFRPRRKILPGW